MSALRILSETYFRLVRRHPLRRLTSEDDLKAAAAVIDELLKKVMDAGEEAYLDALTVLVHAYERECQPIPAVLPAELLRELAETNSLTGRDVAARTGIAASTVSALMTGTRRPTPEQAVQLGRAFNISPAAFLHCDAEAAPRKRPPSARSRKRTRKRSAGAGSVARIVGEGESQPT